MSTAVALICCGDLTAETEITSVEMGRFARSELRVLDTASRQPEARSNSILLDIG